MKKVLLFVSGIVVGCAGFVQDVYFDPRSLSQYQHVHWTLLPPALSRRNQPFFVSRKRLFLNLAPTCGTTGARLVRDLENLKETLDINTSCHPIKMLALEQWGRWVAAGRMDEASQLTVWFLDRENVRQIEQAVDWERAEQAFPAFTNAYFHSDWDEDETPKPSREPTSVSNRSFRLDSTLKWRQTPRMDAAFRSTDPLDSAAERNAAANELFSLPELPEGVVGDLARMFRSPDEDEVWRDYCLQFLGSALERTDGVTDADRALARETLVEALDSTNATFAGTALRALHRGDPADPLVASNALRIARDPSYPASSRTTAFLILEECVRATSSTHQPFNHSTLAETATAVSADSTGSPLLRQAAEAVLKRNALDPSPP